MKVIMLMDVAKVGRKGTIVDVSDGFALNSLIPAKKAVMATKEAVAKHQAAQKRASDEKVAHDAMIEAAVRGVDGAAVTVSAKANEIGHLFGKIHAKEIVTHIEAGTKVKLDVAWISFGADVITEVGEHVIKVAYGKAKAEVKFVVAAAK
jgi:large subunit ribosomal protein L9